MRPLIVGIGKAGCKVASLFLKKGSSRVEYEGVLLDTDRAHLKYFENKHRLLIGEGVVDGNGTGMDLELGRRVMAEEAWRIVEAIDSVRSSMDCLLVISSLGGGTGGSGDLLIEELKKNYSEPVYAIGILPSEQDPSQCLVNFVQSFRPVVSKSDAVFPVDNDSLRENLGLRGQLNAINEIIFRAFDGVFRIGEYRAPEELGSNVLTASDVTNTLGGISTVGVGQKGTEEGDEKLDKPDMVVGLTEKAVNNLLVPVGFKSSQRALIVVSGPKNYLDFLGSIPARLWVEKNISGVEVRGGDLPGEDRNIKVTALLSGLRKSEKIKQLYREGEALQGGEGQSNQLHQKVKKLQNRVEELRNLTSDIARELK